MGAEAGAGSVSTLTGGLRDRVTEEMSLLELPARLLALARPGARDGERRPARRACPRALLQAGAAVTSERADLALSHLAQAGRPLEDLKRIKRRFGTTINDVVLAAAAGGAARFLNARGEEPAPLKRWCR